MRNGRDALPGKCAYDKALPGFGCAGRVRHRTRLRTCRTENSDRSEDSQPSRTRCPIVDVATPVVDFRRSPGDAFHFLMTTPVGGAGVLPASGWG